MAPAYRDRLTKQQVGWARLPGSPDRHGSLAQRVIARQLLADQAAPYPLLHARGEFAVLHQPQVQRLHVAEVEEVALPLDQAVGVQPEPAAADSVDLRLRAVGVDRDLLPEADDLTLFVVDEHALIRVLPVVQPLHL